MAVSALAKSVEAVGSGAGEVQRPAPTASPEPAPPAAQKRFGFELRVLIDYQGHDIELKRRIRCLPGSGGGMGEGAGGLGPSSGSYAQYNVFGNVMPDGAAVLVAVTNFCRFANFRLDVDDPHFYDPEPPGMSNHERLMWMSARLRKGDEARKHPQLLSWGPLPPKDIEMPILFWTKDATDLQEVWGYFAPEAYKGPYAKFQIKDWSIEGTPYLADQNFDPPDQFYLYELLRPVRGPDKRGSGKPPGYDNWKHSMSGEAVITTLGLAKYQFDPKIDFIAPWNSKLKMYLEGRGLGSGLITATR